MPMKSLDKIRNSTPIKPNYFITHGIDLNCHFHPERKEKWKKK
jgi:hypothetical protein